MQYVAAALAGVEADDDAEAFECAQHNVLDWEVTGVTPAEDIHVVLAQAVGVAAASDPRDEPLLRKGWWSQRPLVGKAGFLGIPVLAYGTWADTSGVRALAELVATAAF